MLEKPLQNCRAVIAVRGQHTLGAVDLDGFLSNLVTVGKLIRITYNGVAGDTELQIEMRELGFEIAELCDDSNLTIEKFRTTADSYVTRLISAYQFFLDDMEEMGITSIESVIEGSGKQMAEASEELCKRFKYEQERVLKICKVTAEKKKIEEIKELEVKQKVTECSNKVILYEQTIVALQGAVGALSHLAAIMLEAATFWKSMQQMCEEQYSSRKLEAFLDIIKKYDDREKRLKAYQSSAVKQRAVMTCMSWVAMVSVCDDYIKNKVSHEELYSYLCENPTIEESMARIKLLCREFKEQIDKENAKMEKQMRKC